MAKLSLVGLSCSAAKGTRYRKVPASIADQYSATLLVKCIVIRTFRLGLRVLTSLGLKSISRTIWIERMIRILEAE